MNDINFEKRNTDIASRHSTQHKGIAMYACTKFQSSWRSSVFRTKFAQKTLSHGVLGQMQGGFQVVSGCYSFQYICTTQPEPTIQETLGKNISNTTRIPKEKRYHFNYMWCHMTPQFQDEEERAQSKIEAGSMFD